MGMDGDPKARYANAAMTGYPSNEHVYSLPLRLGEYDAAQLIYALEDALGLVLSQYEHGQQTGVRENYVIRQKVVELAGDDLRGGFSGAPFLPCAIALPASSLDTRPPRLQITRPRTWSVARWCAFLMLRFKSGSLKLRALRRGRLPSHLLWHLQRLLQGALGDSRR